MKNKMSISALVGAAFVASAALSPMTQAASSDLSAKPLSSGYTLAEKTEGKCGEAKCGGKKKEEGKCGEGKCGGEKKKADDEGKCGEGKCGGEKKAE
jgi:uncharacterized low-complexity protein